MRCDNCGKEFEVPYFGVVYSNKYGNKFCSIECQTDEQRMSLNREAIKKDKPMLSKEEKLEIINVLDEARSLISSTTIGLCSSPSLAARMQYLRKRLIDKFIADDGVKGE